MKDKNRKDEQLNSLFRAYVEEEESPPERVTDKAKQYMQEAPERVEVTQPVLADGNGAGGAQTRRHTINMRLVWSCVAFLLIVALLLLWYFLRGGDSFSSINQYGRISRSQLTETSLTYSEQEFLPFIESEDVAVYKEYALNEDFGTYEQGEIVLYYLEYTEQEDTQAQLYVEVGDIDFDELDAYKNLEDYREYENIARYIAIETEDDLTYINFLYDIYSYNLMIDTSLDRSVEIILERIDNSF